MLTEEHIFPFQKSTNTVTAASGEFKCLAFCALKNKHLNTKGVISSQVICDLMGLYIGQFITQAAQTLNGSLLEFEFYDTKMHENKQNTV